MIPILFVMFLIVFGCGLIAGLIAIMEERGWKKFCLILIFLGIGEMIPILHAVVKFQSLPGSEILLVCLGAFWFATPILAVGFCVPTGITWTKNAMARRRVP